MKHVILYRAYFNNILENLLLESLDVILYPISLFEIEVLPPPPLPAVLASYCMADVPAVYYLEGEIFPIEERRLFITVNIIF